MHDHIVGEGVYVQTSCYYADDDDDAEDAGEVDDCSKVTKDR